MKLKRGITGENDSVCLLYFIQLYQTTHMFLDLY